MSMIEGESGQQHITAWYRTGRTEFGSTLEDMLITNDTDWKNYLTRTARDVVEELDKRGCDSGFATMAHLLEYERLGVVKKETIVNLFSEVLGL